MSQVEKKVCDLITKRAKVGLKKYGVTMERTDLTAEQWVNHALEEVCDLAVYLMRVRQDIISVQDAQAETDFWKKVALERLEEINELKGIEEPEKPF